MLCLTWAQSDDADDYLMTISVSAFGDSACSEPEGTVCYNLATCYYLTTTNGMATYMQTTVSGGLSIGIYMDSACTELAGALAPVGECGANSCCDASLTSYGSVLESGLYLEYNTDACTPDLNELIGTGTSGPRKSINPSKQLPFQSIVVKHMTPIFSAIHNGVAGGNSNGFVASLVAVGVAGGVAVGYFMSKATKTTTYETVPTYQSTI